MTAKPHLCPSVHNAKEPAHQMTTSYQCVEGPRHLASICICSLPCCSSPPDPQLRFPLSGMSLPSSFKLGPAHLVWGDCPDLAGSVTALTPLGLTAPHDPSQGVSL